MTITLFTADDGFDGVELWATDGTSGGTYEVKDINQSTFGGSNATGGNSEFPDASFTVVGNYAYFLANDGADGLQMWRSDGTAAGTQQVTDLTSDAEIQDIFVGNGALYYVTSSRSNPFGGEQLWQSTGVPGSTATQVVLPANSQEYTFIGSQLYFQVFDAQNSQAVGVYTLDASNNPVQLTFGDPNATLIAVGNSLYAFGENTAERIDGTTVTTLSVPFSAPGSGSSSGDFMAAGTTLFFTNNVNVQNGFENLYAITAGATHAVDVGPTGDVDLGLGYGTLGNKLAFINANDVDGTFDLWISDGTVAGTQKLMVLPTDTGFSAASGLTTVGDELYFQIYNPTGGVELWKTDGTVDGTGMVKLIADANVGATNDSVAPELLNLTASGGLLYFSADSGNGYEPWVSDGTTAGTHQVDDVNTFTDLGVDVSHFGIKPTAPAVLGSQIYFMGQDAAHGYELWTTNGTLAGTHLFADVNPGVANSNPGNLTVSGTNLFFTADDGVHGTELWVSDGTTAGTHLVSDLYPGSGSALPSGSADVSICSGAQVLAPVFAHSVLFESFFGDLLYISDGTDAGTKPLSAAFAGADSAVVAGSKLFYTTTPATGGEELWVSTGGSGTMLAQIGTGAGTIALSAGTISGGLTSHAVLNNTLFFAANDGVHGFEVWKSDGTAAGTSMLKDVNGTSDSSGVANLIVGNHKLYFTAGNGTQLWESDGTTSGTVQVAPSESFANIANLTVAHNELFFTAIDQSNSSLFVADSSGTLTALANVNVNPLQLPANGAEIERSNPALMALSGGVFFLEGGGGGNPFQLWFSNGTAGGTVEVASNFNDSVAAVAGGKLFFAGLDAQRQPQLWTSDGSVAGTHLVTTFSPGAPINDQFTAYAMVDMHAVGNDVEFTVNGPHGAQYYLSDGTAAGTIQLTSASTPEGSDPANFTSIPGPGPVTLTGTASADTLMGTDGNDTITGGAGNDTIDGMGGQDTAIYSGNIADYTITSNANGTLTVADNNGLPDGTDTVKNVETLQFANGTIQYDLANTAPWSVLTTQRDASGSIASTTIVLDGGDKWVNTVNTTHSDPPGDLWDSSHYDAAGNLLETTALTVNNTYTLTVYDTQNAYTWANATITYDANWNMIGVTGVRDDGSHGVSFSEVSAVFDTLQWYTTPYDPNAGTPQGSGTAPANLVLTGGGNADILFGYGGNDTLTGGGGFNILDGGAGDDTLTGGAAFNAQTGGSSVDYFVFHPGNGMDTITNFVAGDPAFDQIQLHGFGIANFAALQPMMSQVGADTVITFDATDHILLQNVTMTQLTANDFLFT